MVPGNIILAACMTALMSAGTALADAVEAVPEVGAKALFYGEGGGNVVVDATRKKTAAARPRTPAPPAQLALMAWVRLVDETGGVSDVSPNRRFRSGERIRFNLKANKPGYLYVANIGTTGKVTMLFPGEGKDNLVKPGLLYEVPDKSGKAIRFDANPGVEEVLVILSPVPLDNRVAPTGGTGRGTVDARPLMQLAEAEGAKDLLVEDDSTALFAAHRPPPNSAMVAQRETVLQPIMLTLKLKHGP